MSREALEVFISYAREDQRLRRKLDQHLALLEREGTIRPWHDRKIAAGDEWRGQIDDRLESADVIVLLVSASFIASDYCFDVEATRALERHALGEERQPRYPDDESRQLSSRLKGLFETRKAIATSSSVFVS